MNAIALENVDKSYGKVKALNQLSLSVREGEIYGFIGPNGAGKSTTIRILLNFLRPGSGKVSVLGYNSQKDEVAIKKNTGYVSADTFMYPDMKVKDLFRFSEYFHKINAQNRIKELVDLLDIDVEKRFEQLSFGNKKKVSIACALIHSPMLLILDEPTNGLDPLIRMRLFELFKEEQKKGVTIFLSSHVLGEVQKISTRIGLLKEGRLIKESDAENFVKMGYRQVRIECKEEIDLSVLTGVAGVEKISGFTSFMYSGDPNDLIRLLAGKDVASIHIEEPELESVFMHYFQ